MKCYRDRNALLRLKQRILRIFQGPVDLEFQPGKGDVKVAAALKILVEAFLQGRK